MRNGPHVAPVPGMPTWSLHAQLNEHFRSRLIRSHIACLAYAQAPHKFFVALYHVFWFPGSRVL